MEAITEEQKLQLAQQTHELIKNIQEGKWGKQNVTQIGQGDNTALIFNTPLNVAKEVVFTEGEKNPANVDQFVVVSPQHGIGVIEFVKEGLFDGQWKPSLEQNSQEAFVNALKMYGNGESNDYRETGVYPSDSIKSDFSLKVGGISSPVLTDFPEDTFKKAIITNKIEATPPEVGAEELAKRLSRVEEALKLELN